jgi:hypothetical protein
MPQSGMSRGLAVTANYHRFLRDSARASKQHEGNHREYLANTSRTWIVSLLTRCYEPCRSSWRRTPLSLRQESQRTVEPECLGIELRRKTAVERSRLRRWPRALRALPRPGHP